MKNRSLELKVGVLVVVALGLLAVFIAVLGNFSLAKGFNFYVNFGFTGNLHAGAPVKVAGIRVGKVEAIKYLGGELNPRTKERVYVRIKVWVEERVRGTVFSDAEFFINTQGVLGEQYLEIVPGTRGKKPVGPNDVLTGVTPPRADLIVARLYEFLDGVTKLLRSDKKTISNLLRAGTRAVSAMEVVLKQNQEQIGKLLGNLEELSRESTGLIKTARAGVGDPRRIRNTLVNVEKTTASLARNMDGLLKRTNKALDGVTEATDAIGPAEKKRIREALDRLLKLSDRVYALAGDAQKMVGGIARGKGTVGAMVVKDELYDDIKEMVRDLKRNPWKFLWRE